MSQQDDAYPLVVRDKPSRFSCFPILNPELWRIYKDEALPSTWFADDIDLSNDLKDWKEKLTDNERHFLKHVLCFFAGMDSVVAENLSINFVEELKVLEITMFYQWQAFNEQIHAETYATIIDTYFDDAAEKAFVFDAVRSMPVIAAKAQWALGFSHRESSSFAKRLVAFICLEGIMFAGSFASIFYFRSRGLLRGLSQANDYIQRDETLHVRFAIEVYALLKERLPESEVHEIFRTAVALEETFLTEALPVNLVGLRNGDMVEYIRYVADFWLVHMGYSKIYEANNPLDFMRRSALVTKPNFFEVRATEYQTVSSDKQSLFDEAATF
ncbi:Ribonucleoside-diphosphate reductase small subunit [Hondaea fermentalgiana]|uniref:Ribonucleoside-diphosphate reductase small subunit n=1 Tax=Hondaea fermentalgiana TaxID=2315210 RepID=A0A2R5H2J8_9STRA|nr:Ribonucleoside-diphosphate reductase small subunit [Hondaea fermentalgiana]|eukprot:GBG35061.1 Ribonucleoside-diphosphate reductase small subunit [Hondaea fermentalgiana]